VPAAFFGEDPEVVAGTVGQAGRGVPGGGADPVAEGRPGRAVRGPLDDVVGERRAAVGQWRGPRLPLRCQWPAGSARGRSVEVPVGGHWFCHWRPTVVSDQSVSGLTLAARRLGEPDRVAGGDDDVGVLVWARSRRQGHHRSEQHVRHRRASLGMVTLRRRFVRAFPSAASWEQ
jgi:hypothetical protein